VSNSTPLSYKKIEDKKKCIMKTKEPFVKVYCYIFNEVVKHPLLKINFDIGRFFGSFKIFQYPYYSISTTFHDSHVIKVAPHRHM
jgi:hypothetical protein